MFTRIISAFFIAPILLLATQSIAQPSVQRWTLESSVLQALTTAPELKKSMAEIGARQADIGLSGLWPDPSIEFRVDNMLGQDDGSGGYDLTDVTISQAIPLSRTKYQQSAAEANLRSAEFSRKHKALQVQNRVSKVFHQLQLASAEFSLAEKRLQLADDLIRQTQKNSQGVIVRFLTPLEKMRLTIIREEASQAKSNAEGQYHEALNEFAKLLGVEPDMATTVSKLQPLSVIPGINNLLAVQDNHVQLASQQQQLLSATHEIDVARNSQTEDPTISLSRSRESFAGGRDEVYGIMFNIQIPLHDRKSKAVSKANYKASQQRIELQRLKRELQIDLERSHTHLNHVVGQAASYATKILKPASKMLDLTNKGFTSGELNVLQLVDANNTYFEAQLNYLELLYQAWVELAEVKLFAGQLIADVDLQNVSMIEGGQ